MFLENPCGSRTHSASPKNTGPEIMMQPTLRRSSHLRKAEIRRFLGLEHTRAKIEAYRVDYNEDRPHGSLDNRTPMEFARSITGLAQRAVQ